MITECIFRYCGLIGFFLHYCAHMSMDKLHTHDTDWFELVNLINALANQSCWLAMGPSMCTSDY